MSREMIPDVTLSAVGTAKVVALDAKYRVGQDLNSALASAHMYRDAIVVVGQDGRPESAVAGSYLLSPHRPRLAEEWKTMQFSADRIFHPGYRAEFSFGAFTMRPGMSAGEIAALLKEAVTPLGPGAWPTD